MSVLPVSHLYIYTCLHLKGHPRTSLSECDEKKKTVAESVVGTVDLVKGRLHALVFGLLVEVPLAALVVLVNVHKRLACAVRQLSGSLAVGCPILDGFECLGDIEVASFARVVVGEEVGGGGTPRRGGRTRSASGRATCPRAAPAEVRIWCVG